MLGDINSFLNVLESFGDKVALSHREHGEWKEISYQNLVKSSKEYASYLISDGVKSGSKIAIVSDSNYYYLISIFGSFLAGCTCVPVDVKLSINEMISILGHAEIDRIDYSDSYEKVCINISNEFDHEIIIRNISSPIKESDFANIVRKDFLDYKIPALLVYTSGTTSKPKGVMISWDNLFFEINAIKKTTNFQNENLLSILPLNHMFELSGGVLSGLYIGSTIYFANTYLAQELLSMFKQKRITIMLVVPLVLELFHKSILKRVEKLTTIEQTIFKFTVLFSKFLPSFFKSIVFSKVHDVFGNDFRGFISGGSKLNMKSYDFFKSLGYDCFQGYGLTETSPVVCMNGPKSNKRGTIGKPLDGVEVKISKSNNSEGVLYVKGPNVMMGYYKDVSQTQKVIDKDGWFNTGDIAKIDKDGFIEITGREKDLIVLDGGKKVYPEEIEQLFLLEDKLEEVCVTSIKRLENGVLREKVGALIIPSEHMLQAFKCEEKLKIEVTKIFNDYKNSVASYKWPSYILVDTKELEKTTTKKIKRNIVKERILNFI